MWDSYTLSTHGDILFYPSISPMGGDRRVWTLQRSNRGRRAFLQGVCSRPFGERKNFAQEYQPRCEEQCRLNSILNSNQLCQKQIRLIVIDESVVSL